VIFIAKMESIKIKKKRTKWLIVAIVNLLIAFLITIFLYVDIQDYLFWHRPPAGCHLSIVQDITGHEYKCDFIENIGNVGVGNELNAIEYVIYILLFLIGIYFYYNFFKYKKRYNS